MTSSATATPAANGGDHPKVDNGGATEAPPNEPAPSSAEPTKQVVIDGTSKVDALKPQKSKDNTDDTKDMTPEHHPTSPVTQPTTIYPAYSMPTPQQQQQQQIGGYYFEPPSPGWFAQQFPPQSPATAGRQTSGSVPPASPLFPRAGAFDKQQQPPTSPFPSNAAFGAYTAAAGYSTYASALTGAPAGAAPDANGQDDSAAWGERPQPQIGAGHFPPVSPSLQGLPPIPYGSAANTARSANVNIRSNSFDQMLPPSTSLDGSDPAAYSPYGAGSLAANGQPPPFSAPWGMDAAAMYGAPNVSPGSAGARPPHHHHPHAPPPPHHAPPYGGPMHHHPPPPPMGHHPHAAHHHPYHAHGAAAQQAQAAYYPATSPGPPIQTTASNKGPDGANLFIFHIPNHFTNLDMYRLFCQYGNLLSVRIMVERDTGRSRGFGFVSYDSPESAALAIKELNGFAIGNKRLKVQHKQIRATDQQRYNSNNNGHHHQGGGVEAYNGDYTNGGGDYNQDNNGASFLPHPWYDASTMQQQPQQQQQVEVAPEGVDPSPLTASLDPIRAALPDISAPPTGGVE